VSHLTSVEQAALESALAYAHKYVERARKFYDARDDYEEADEMRMIATHLGANLEAELRKLRRLRTRPPTR
jgi:hypothetical protein